MFDQPAHKYVSVDIMGADGEIDLSDVLTDYPVFNNRRGTLKFRMFATKRKAYARYSEIMNTLHGQKMRCILDEEPEYYYFGRFTVSEFEYKRVGEWADISIDYNVEPYKYLIGDSTDDWLWDPFNFETGVIRGYKNLVVNGLTTHTIIGSRMPVTPKFIVTFTSGTSMKVTFDGNTYTLSEGTNIIPTIILAEGENILTFNTDGTVSSGKVTIDFMGGSL